MREALLSGRTILVPDNVTFAFNPMRVKIDDAAGVISISITDGVQTFTDAREPIGGKVAFDLSLYARSFFAIDRISQVNAKTLTCTITEGLNISTFTTLTIWGAMNIGEIFNGDTKAIWYKNLPFTFTIYAVDDVTIQASADGGAPQSLRLSQGYHHIDPSTIFNPTRFGTISITGDLSTSVWEYTFDETFRGLTDIQEVTKYLEVSECTSGIYMRWLNRHGGYSYYLFKQGEEVTQSKMDGADVGVHSDSLYEYTGIYRPKVKETGRIIKAAASLVDVDIFRMISTIFTSPMVDMYLNGVWTPVLINDNNLADTGKPLQDIEIEIIMPKIVTQSL